MNRYIMAEGKNVRNYCNSCKKETNHLIQKEYTQALHEHYALVSLFQIVECNGCNEISFIRQDIDYEVSIPYVNEYGEEGYNPDISLFQYPIPLKYHSGFDMDELYELPKKIKTIYQDTLKSYANGSTILVGAGLRACVEAVCNDLNITGKDLEQRIKKLNQNGYISKSNMALLNGVRFMGNDAVHDMKESTHDEIKVALRVVEHLFENVYILPKLAKGKLKTTIDNYDEFKQILSENLKSFNSGDEYGLYILLGENYRRCQDNITSFQSHLIQDINGGNFSLLKIGQVKTHNNQAVQCFIIV